ncbi:MAG: DUF3467 domain-containing protein [Flavobacteriales bacterium]|jgi:hypothetical protein|nr:DUF3467 domain-containing protein [Flavobacteriales bacterium]NCG28928.1 DUF3467 domain-containing protein [Bacteroidota bacterium]MBT3963828.1 DUF3467 domain-containing protein [Flavobacteriales bacterium]MBT4704667.1 DUF3467 domain-containing protein [Flavobacteriales bacterium]MBT4931750.1 DUF3467 domain-containing protein [Flavobacteriales bacterium]
MADEKDQKQSQINIELSEEMAQGVYSNLAIITHSNAEFIVDFVSMMPGTPKAQVKSRIILTPQHAKRLLNALNENVKKFEAQNGEIAEIDQGQSPFPMNFGPAGEA